MGSNRRRCEGIIVERPSHKPYWKRCTAFAMHDLDYCVSCFQRRKQNDSARKCLVPGWEKILVGDPSREGKGRTRLGLDEGDKQAAAELRAQARPRPPTPAPTEPVLLNKLQARSPVAPPLPPPPDEPEDVFASARKALAAISKI